MGLKLDFISIIVYACIIIVLYHIIFMLGWFWVAFLSLPGLSQFRIGVFEKPWYMQIKSAVWGIIYSRYIFAIMTVIFAVLLIIILICWFIYGILLPIPFGIGLLLIEVIPPLKAFEQAGFYRLVDDSIDVFGKFMPINWFVAILMWFLNLQRFCVERIIDLVLLINPDVELEPSKYIQFIDELQLDIKKNPRKFTWKEMNKRLRGDFEYTETFANKEDKELKKKEKEEKKQEKAEQNLDKIKHKDLHKEGTKEMIQLKSEADIYKSMKSITPDMSMTERTSIVLNNQLKKVSMGVANIKPTIDINMATLPKSSK